MGCCGKDNSHIFHDATADEAFKHFDSHLWALIGFDEDNPGPDPFVGGLRKSRRDAIMAASPATDRYVYADGDPSKKFGWCG